MTPDLHRLAAVCPWCGPHYGEQSNSHGVVCPTCGLDAGEVRYAEMIMRLGGEVYRREWRAAHGLPIVEAGVA